jgi:hypothetical protein
MKFAFTPGALAIPEVLPAAPESFIRGDLSYFETGVGTDPS